MALVPHGGGAGGSATMAMPMLTADNYTVWAIKAQAILDVHTVWEAVAPGDAAVNARKDKMARALLLGALPEDVLLQVSTKLTAREVWDSLKFHDVTTMAFDEALGRLRAFDERVRRRGQDGGERGGEQLLMTAAQWAARERRHGGARDDDDGRSVASGSGGNRRRRCYKCGEHGHFRRECPQLRKGSAAEQALLAGANVDDDGLL
ncbi:hypothetical protein VPH35_120655 [Triticum aestivum]